MLGYDGGDGSAGCSSAPPTLGAPQSTYLQVYLVTLHIFLSSFLALKFIVYFKN